MGGLTSIASAMMPTASTALIGYQQQQYKAQNEATDRAAQQQSLDRRYAEERQARLEEQQQRERERQSEWQRQDQLRQQDLELERQRQATDVAQQAAQRRDDMAWLGQSQTLDAAQLRARQDADAQAAGADAQTRLAALSQQAAADEQRRRDALRRTVGRTRADLGGQGVGSADGSGEAILLGLVGESDQEGRTAAQVDQLKRQAIQQELDNSRRRNLLEQAQLAQRQRMEFMSKFF